MSAISKPIVAARGFFPGVFLECQSGRMRLHVRRKVRVLPAPALLHFLQHLDAGEDLRIAPVSDVATSTLLLSWLRNPVALYCDRMGSAIVARELLAAYPGTPLAVFRDRFFVQHRYAVCLTGEGYVCPVLATLIPRCRPRSGVRRFRLLDDEEHLVAISTEVPGCTSFDIWDTNRRAVRRDVDTHSLTMALFEEVLDWERQTDPNPKVGLELVMGWRRMKAVQLRPFLFELFHPANHVVKVMPPKSVRSVEWHEARSHYLILDRKAMAHVGPMAGKISEAESAEAIRRAAHRRRAHTRVLRHPKWGTRIGYIVHVKSAWIGPKQWEGPDGKTYVLMERKPAA